MNHRHSSKGAAVITVVLIFLALSALIGSASSRIVIGEADRARTYGQSEQSYFTAESAAEDVVYRLKKGYAVSATESVPVGSTTVTIKSTSANGVQYISATSTLNDAYRTVRLGLQSGIAIGFPFAIEAGVTGLTMSGSARINGNTHSNGAIAGSGVVTINGNASAVGTIQAPPALSLTGTKTPGAATQPFPTIDVPYWQAQANINNDPIVGNKKYDATMVASLGPRKIQGDLTITASSQLTVTGPIHVTGNLTIDGSARVYLDSAFASKGTVIIVDGTVTIGGSGNIFATSASPKGYILIYTGSTSNSAVTLNGASGVRVMISAPNGKATVAGSAAAIALAAKSINISGAATLGTDAVAFPSATFGTGGAGGGFQIQSWGETQ